MQAAHLVPELALARVVTAGGPYRPGDEISLAFTTPSISRLVAHDPALRATCVPLEGALVPEMICVTITHTAAPFSLGDVLTLSFVDPRIARVYLGKERQGSNVSELPTRLLAIDEPSPPTTPAEPFTQARSPEGMAATEAIVHRANVQPIERTISEAARPEHRLADAVGAGSSYAGDAAEASPAGDAAEAFPAGDAAEAFPAGDVGSASPQVRAGERMTLESNALARSEAAPDTSASLAVNCDEVSAAGSPAGDRNPALAEGESLPHQSQPLQSLPQSSRPQKSLPRSPSQQSLSQHSVAQQSSPQQSSPQQTLPQQAPPYVRGSARITVRLDWNQERLRRFVQVVDKLFTIDRLGWYRHSLAMRLLIPDEIDCGDTLAGIEAMRHLQALRAAAVESLGKPLLAACMPGFSITSEWLDSIESPREARAISGLREALLPYADDAERAIETPTHVVFFTTGTIVRRELLAENAASVEAFLPLLIAPCSHEAKVSASLAEYRRLLVELFTQTARASEPVRLHQMAQANHSLDDRLWQVVGATAEAFGGFALT